MPALLQRTLAALVLLGSVLFSAVSGAAQPLVAGTTANYPPVVFEYEGQISGIEADFARLLASQTGREVRFEVMPWEELIPALKRGDIDLIMAGMSATAARENDIDFTRPYTRAGQMLIIRTENVARFSSPLRVLKAGVRLGYETGTTGADFLQEMPALTTTRGFDSAEAGLAALQSGEIDALLHDAPTSWHLATESRYGDLMSLYRPLTEEYLAWGVRKDDPQLKALLNDELQRMRQTGTLEHVLNRWIPVKVMVE